MLVAKSSERNTEKRRLDDAQRGQNVRWHRGRIDVHWRVLGCRVLAGNLVKEKGEQQLSYDPAAKSKRITYDDLISGEEGRI